MAPSIAAATALRLLGMAAIWGATFAVTRALALDLPHSVAALLRQLFALAVLAPLLLRAEGGRCLLVSRPDVVRLVLLGATGVAGYNALLFAGTAEVTATRAALIVPANAVVTPLLLAAAGRERLAPIALVGVLLAFLGAVLVIVQGDLHEIAGSGIGRGELYLFGCIACWVAYTLLGRIALRRLSPLAMTTGAVAFGALLLTVPAAGELARHEWLAVGLEHWLELGFLGVFGTAIAFVWYSRGVQEIGAGRASLFITLVPVFGVVVGVVYLGEDVTASLLAGGALVVAGLVLATRRRD